MESIRSCQRCGTALTERATAGLCPRCLLESAVRLVAAPDQTTGTSRPGSPTDGRPPEVGRLGNYELLERIASGGMGVVYRARQAGLDRIVALKVLPFGPFTRDEFVERFQLEASAAARLRHPNIVSIFEVGKADGFPFFSMEFVEGPTLAALVQEKPLPTDRAVRLVRSIAEAVHYAHQQGVLHRDLKPSNVLVDALDQPRITDFGLAKQMDNAKSGTRNAELTLSGQSLGTPNFMPPEQAEGRHDEVGPRSDVYGLGAILYHLVTGRPPFTADSAVAVLRQVVQSDPPAPRVLNPSLPRDIETICLRCLEKDPARRFASAQEIADELGRFQRGEPILARPISPPARLWRWCRRRPAIATLLATVFIVFGAGLVATLSQWRRAETSAARLADAVTRLELDRAEDWLGHGEVSDALAQLAAVLRREPHNRVAATRLVSVLSQRRFLLPTDQVIQDDFVGRNSAFAQHGDWLVTATNRGETLQLWNTRGGLRLESLLPCGEPVRAASFRGDGRQLVAATAEGNVWLFDLPERVTQNAANGVRPSPGAETFESARASGNSMTRSRPGVAATEDGSTPRGTNEARNRLRLVDSNDRQLAGLAPGLSVAANFKIGGYIDRILLSPDGSQVIAHFSGPNSDDWKRARLAVVETATGRVLRHETNLHWAAFSPDGARLVTVGGRAAQLRHPSTWEANGPSLTHGARINTAEFSPDSILLVTASADRSARLWRAETGERVGAPMRHDLQVLAAVFSPDGSRVLSVTGGRSGRLWDGNTGAPVSAKFEHARGISPDSFSADSAFVVSFSENEVRLRDAATGAPRAEPLDVGHSIPRARFIGDGRQVLLSTFGGEARAWKVPAGLPPGHRLEHQAEVNAVAISPDAALIAAGLKESMAQVWNAKTAEPIVSLNHPSQVMQLVFDPGGTRLATASSDPSARLWELSSGQLLGELRHREVVRSVGFSPDGRWLVTCSEDGTARLWNADTLEPSSAPLRHRGHVRNAAFGPDGRILATAGTDNTARLWSVPDGTPIGEPLLHSNWVSAVTFSPDGRVLATCGSEKGARLWNVVGPDAPANRKAQRVDIRAVLAGHEAHVHSVQFDALGRRVVTASGDKTARLWRVADGAALARPLRHDGPVIWAGFSPDGQYVLTASSDGTARLWDATTGHVVADPLRHDNGVTAARWSPQGHFVVTGSDDRTVRVWPVEHLALGHAPPWLADLAEAVGGKRLIGDELSEPVKPPELLRLREALAIQTKPGPYRQWLNDVFGTGTRP